MSALRRLESEGRATQASRGEILSLEQSIAMIRGITIARYTGHSAQQRGAHVLSTTAHLIILLDGQGHVLMEAQRVTAILHMRRG